ncbi:hypothetical protein KQX54_010760 [Cotesia glomerata]|uniref:Uncharacterized protein n=1 Tax=Cotesia glomerata TaxID=32391 RepID=A0AAV7J798_COTGL|nr:hypothetical protein KQX54_010760 [Cotesia glomerata]
MHHHFHDKSCASVDGQPDLRARGVLPQYHFTTDFYAAVHVHVMMKGTRQQSQRTLKRNRDRERREEYSPLSRYTPLGYLEDPGRLSPMNHSITINYSHVTPASSVSYGDLSSKDGGSRGAVFAGRPQRCEIFQKLLTRELYWNKLLQEEIISESILILTISNHPQFFTNSSKSRAGGQIRLPGSASTSRCIDHQRNAFRFGPLLVWWLEAPASTAEGKEEEEEERRHCASQYIRTNVNNIMVFAVYWIKSSMVESGWISALDSGAGALMPKNRQECMCILQRHYFTGVCVRSQELKSRHTCDDDDSIYVHSEETGVLLDVSRVGVENPTARIRIAGNEGVVTSLNQRRIDKTVRLVQGFLALVLYSREIVWTWSLLMSGQPTLNLVKLAILGETATATNKTTSEPSTCSGSFSWYQDCKSGILFARYRGL